MSFGTNMVSFLLVLVTRRWYVFGTYVPPNDVPVVQQVYQALEAKPKGGHTISFVDINARL